MHNSNSFNGLAWIGATAFFMQTLDATILNTALPSIALSLHESALDMQLSVISYSISLALFIPLSGWLSDRYGCLTIFRLSVFGFILGSFLCTLSTSLNQLIIFRVIQGAGGALMMPVVRLVIIRIVPKKQLLNVWNLMAMSGLLGPILGPILGGIFVTYLSWHWIFLINIPVGLIGIFLAGWHIPNLKNMVDKLDWKGFLLFSLGLVGLTLGLDLVAEVQTPVTLTLIILFTGLFSLFIYYFYARSYSKALLPLALFDIRTFKLSLFANLLFRLFATGIPFLLPLMFQVVFYYDADIAGWLLAPIPIFSILMKFFINRILKRLGYKLTLILFSILIMLTIAAMGLLQQTTPLWIVVLLFSAYGAFTSVFFTAINTLAVSDMTEHLASAGTTMLSIIQQIGIGIGIGVVSIILSFYRQVLGENTMQLQNAFSYTFFTTSILGVALVWALTYLKRCDGNSLY